MKSIIIIINFIFIQCKGDHFILDPYTDQSEIESTQKPKQEHPFNHLMHSGSKNITQWKILWLKLPALNLWSKPMEDAIIGFGDL